jgi:hypothetical protein
MDEEPDTTFYVLAEPALSEPAPDDASIWPMLAQLRTENHAWRQCVAGILADAQRYAGSSDALKLAVEERIQRLGHLLGAADRHTPAGA